MPKRTGAKKPKLSEDKEELLISHVRQYPVLYTIKHKRYYDTKFKAGIWQTIAAILEEEKDIVQSSWDLIKAKYKREKKKVAEAAKIKELYNPNWNLYSSLQFLDEVHLPQKTESNLDSLFTDKPNTVKTMDKHSFDLIQSLLSPPKEVSSGSSRSHENHASTRATSDNEDLIFFNSLLDHVSKVPDDKKLKMRNEIQNIIMKYAYAKSAEAECCCSALNCSAIGPRHPRANMSLHNTQQTSGTIKKEIMNKKVKVECNYDSEDSDCEYLGHVVPVKKLIPRNMKKKTSKKQGQALFADTPPLLQMDPSQELFKQMMLQQQQQQYQMLQNLFNFGTRPISAAASATVLPPADLQGNQKSSETKTNSKQDVPGKET